VALIIFCGFLIHVQCGYFSGVQTPEAREEGIYDLLLLGRYHACITALTFGMVLHGVSTALTVMEYILPRAVLGS